MNIAKLTFCVLALITLLFSGCKSPNTPDNIYQFSTIDALLSGGLDGDITYKKVKEKGGFGLGTFNTLDGEMVALHGNFYQIKADGKAYAVADSLKAPFVTVTHFEADTTFQLSQIDSLHQIFDKLDDILPSQNLIYAVQISGSFNYLKTRSVPSQSKPYPPLADVIAHQPEFEFQHIQGDMVGFRFPAYASSINASPWHFHFINQERTQGGHLLEANLQNAEVRIDISHHFELELPDDPYFYSVELSE